MRRLTAFGVLTSLVISLAAAALANDAAPPSDMTDEERAALRAEIRAYLLENPDVLVEAQKILEERERLARSERDMELIEANSAAIFASPTDWVGGNPQGDITLVEFMDYRCSYCRKAHDEVQTLVKTDGNIRYVVKELPILGEGSIVSSQFAIAVRLLHGDDAYKAAHDALIDLRGEPTANTLTRLATHLGHEAGPILAKMPTEEVMSILLDNRALADTLEISGTPTFALEDVMVRGYRPLKTMQEIVTELRKGG